MEILSMEERVRCYKEHRELTGHDFNCADPGSCQFIEILLEEVKYLKAGRNKLKKWIDDLLSGTYVNCVYCGHRYGPNPGTPVAMAGILKEHIEQCPKHPMSLLKVQYDKLLEKVNELKGWANRIADDERVCGWIHEEDYNLYLLLADCPVDFDKIFEGVHERANDTIEAAERLTTLLKEK